MGAILASPMPTPCRHGRARIPATFFQRSVHQGWCVSASTGRSLPQALAHSSTCRRLVRTTRTSNGSTPLQTLILHCPVPYLYNKLVENGEDRPDPVVTKTLEVQRFFEHHLPVVWESCYLNDNAILEQTWRDLQDNYSIYGPSVCGTVIEGMRNVYYYLCTVHLGHSQTSLCALAEQRNPLLKGLVQLYSLFDPHS